MCVLCVRCRSDGLISCYVCWSFSLSLSLSLSFLIPFFLGMDRRSKKEGRKEVRLGKRPLKIYLLTLLVVGGGERTMTAIFYEAELKAVP